MKNRFAVHQKSLLAILSSMQPVCSKKTVLDVTSCILFNVGHRELILKATDLEVSLQLSHAFDGCIDQDPCTFLVPGKRIFELVKELDDTIECGLDGQQLTMRAGGVNLSLNVKDADEFPPFPERIENLMQFDAAYFLDLLHNVAFLIPQSNANPALNGLLFEISSTGLVLTATDGHCLVQVSTPRCVLDEQRSWLLPRRAVFEIRKLIESLPEPTIFVGTCGNQLVFSGSTFNFFTRLLADPFPSYRAILAHNDFVSASVERAPFVKALRRSACLLANQFVATQFDFRENNVKVAMNNKEVGTLEEEVALEHFGGSPLGMRFYAPYLLNGLQAFSGDSVSFFLKGQLNPIIFEETRDDARLTYLVMPVSAPHSAS